MQINNYIFTRLNAKYLMHYLQLWEHKIVEIKPLNVQCYRSVDLAR